MSILKRERLSNKGKLEYSANDFVGVLNYDDPLGFDIYQIYEEVRTTLPSETMIRARKFIRDPEEETRYERGDECQIAISSLLKKVVPFKKSIDGDTQEYQMIESTKRISTILQNLVSNIKKAEVRNDVISDEESSDDTTLGKRKPRRAKLIAIEGLQAGIQSIRSDISNSDEDGDADEEPQKLAQEAEGNPIVIATLLKKAKKEKAPSKRLGKNKEFEVETKDYKKGKFNNLVELLDITKSIDGQSSENTSDCCDICANREFINSIKNKDFIRYNELLNSKKLVNIWSTYGSDSTENSVLELLKQRDVSRIRELLKKDDIFKNADPFKIVSTSTGYNSKYAYGVATREVELGRGNRQGNMAFIANEIFEDDTAGVSNENWAQHELIVGCNTPTMILKQFYNRETDEGLGNYFDGLSENIVFGYLVRSGRYKEAADIAESLEKRGGFGLNNLHTLALTATKGEELGTFREVSITKKTMGDKIIFPIFCAAINPNPSVFQTLYDQLSNKFVQDEEFSSLIHYAAANEAPEVLQILLDDNVPINITNRFKETALFIACKYGRYKNAELLLKKGAQWKKQKSSRNQYGFCAIHAAVVYNHISVLKVLHENGVDMNQNYKFGKSPLHLAAEEGLYEVAEYLIDIGCSTVKRDKFKRTIAITAIKNGYSRFSALLFKHGCPWNEPDSSENYPLHYACAYGAHDIIDVLLKAGADINQLNSWKMTPISIAVLKNHKRVVAKILEYDNVDVDCKDDSGRTLINNLASTPSSSSLSLTSLLVTKHSASLFLADLSLCVPLHTFAYSLSLPGTLSAEQSSVLSLSLPFFKLLGPNLALFTLKDLRGRSPLEIALERLIEIVCCNRLGEFSKVQRNAQLSSTELWKDNENCYFMRFSKEEERELEAMDTIRKLLAMVAKMYREEKEKDKRGMREEGEEEVAEKFYKNNQQILPQVIAQFRGYFLKTELPASAELDSNPSVPETIKEITYFTKKIHSMKNFIIEIISFLVNEFDFDPEWNKDGVKSAKDEILEYLLYQWNSLYNLPPKSQYSGLSHDSLIKEPQNKSGLFNSNNSRVFGGSFSNFGGYQNYSSNQQKYITGMNEDSWELLNKYRDAQIDARSKFLQDALEILKAVQSKIISSDWEKHYTLSSRSINIIENVIFKNPTTTMNISQGSPEILMDSCEKFFESTESIAKEFISLAMLGDSEQKTRIVGRSQSLIYKFIGILKKAYNDVNQCSTEEGSTSSRINRRLFIFRISFLQWFLDQMNASTISLSDKIEDSQESKIELDSEKTKYQISKRTYQRSLVDSLVEFVSQVYGEIVCKFPLQIGKVEDFSYDIDYTIEANNQVLALSNSILEFIKLRLDDKYYPYAKHRLISSLGSKIDLLHSQLLPINVSHVLSEKQQIEKSSHIILNEVYMRSRMTSLDKLIGFATKIIMSDGPTPTLHELDTTFTDSDTMNRDDGSASTLHNFFELLKTLYNLDGVSKCKNMDESISIQLTMLKAKVLNLCAKMVEHNIFEDYKLNKYRYLQILDEISRDISGLKRGSLIDDDKNNLILNMFELISSALKQVERAYSPEEQIPKHITAALLKVKEDGSNFNIDLEEYCKSNRIHPATTLLTSEIFSFNILDLHRQSSGSLNQSEEFLLEEDLQLTIGDIIKARLNIGIQLFDMIEKAYNDLKTYGKITTSELVEFIKKGCRYASASQIQFLNHQASKNVEENIRVYIDSASEPLLKLFNKSAKFVTIADPAREQASLKQFFTTYKATLALPFMKEDLMLKFTEILFKVVGNLNFMLNSKYSMPITFYFAENATIRLDEGSDKSVSRDFYRLMLKYSSKINPTYRLEVKNTIGEDHRSLLQCAIDNSNFNLLTEMMILGDSKINEELNNLKNQFLLFSLIDYKEGDEIIEFMRQLGKRISPMSPILTARRNGYTCILQFIQSVLESNYTRRNMFLNNPNLLFEIVGELSTLGIDISAVFNDKEKLDQHLQNPEGKFHPLLELEGFNIVHFILRSEKVHKKHSEHIEQIISTFCNRFGVNVNQVGLNSRTPLIIVSEIDECSNSAVKALLESGANPNILTEKGSNAAFFFASTLRFDCLELLAKHGANFDISNDRGNSPLIIVIKSKEVIHVEKMFALGASANHKDNLGRNSLHWALNYAEAGSNASFEIETLLIENGAEVNTPDKLGRTPLHYPFVKSNDFTMSIPTIDPVESVNSLLLRKGLILNSQDIFGFSPLMYASQRGSLVCSLYLLQQGADINLKNFEGNNAFTISMANDHQNLAITLINSGAEWDIEIVEHTSIARKLMEKQAIDNRDGSRDQTHQQFTEILRNDEKVLRVHTFRFAVRKDWQGLAYMIISKGYNIGKAVYETILENKFKYTFNLLTKREDGQEYQFISDEGLNLFHLIAGKSTLIQDDLLKKICWILKRKGIDHNATDKTGRTSLHWAAYSGSANMIKILLENGADPNQVTLDSERPLDLAFNGRNSQVFSILIDITKDNLSPDRYLRNAAHYACMDSAYSENDTLELLKYLKKKNIDFNLIDDKGKLPLHYMTKHSAFKVKSLEYILNETLMHTVDKSGQTPLMIFCKTSSDSTLLLELIKATRILNVADRYKRTFASNILQMTQIKMGDHSLHKDIAKYLETSDFKGDAICSFWVGVDKEGKPIYKEYSLLDYAYKYLNQGSNIPELLLKKGALADRPNPDGESTADILTKRKSTELLKNLIKASSSQLKIGEQPSTHMKENISIGPIGYMIMKSFPNQIIQYFIQGGVDPNQRDSSGLVPLDYISSESELSQLINVKKRQIENNHPKESLLDFNVVLSDKFHKSNSKKTPLILAILERYKDCLIEMTNKNLHIDSNFKGDEYPAYYILKTAEIDSNLMENVLNGFYSQATMPQSTTIVNDKHPWFKLDFKIETSLAKFNDKRVVEGSPLFWCVVNSLNESFILELLHNIPSLDYYDHETGISPISLSLIKNKAQTIRSIFDCASLNELFYKTHSKEIKKHDWRDQQQRTLPLNVLFSKSYGTLKDLYKIEKKVDIVEEEEEVPDFLADDQDKMIQEDTVLKSAHDSLTYPIILMYENNYDFKLIIQAIELGADPNLTEPSTGHNIIMKAIMNNDENLIREIIKKSTIKIDSDVVDKNGRTPIHYVVNSHKNGSYENTSLLKFLAEYYPANKADNSKLPPIHYASLQDSGVMYKCLLDLGIPEYEIPFGVQRAPTSLIAFSNFPDYIPDYEEDSQRYIAEKSDEMKKLKKDERKLQKKDKYCSMPNTELVYDEVYGAFDAYMIKTDIKRGEFSCNIFYKMQIVRDTNRGVYFLFNRWGRIGEPGQYQMTAFSTKEGVEEEYCKLFKAKTGNIWEEKDSFTKYKKKYNLVPMEREIEDEFVEGFYDKKTDDDYPVSTLGESVKEFFNEVTSMKALQKQAVDYSFGDPIHRIDRVKLLQANQILDELLSLAKQREDALKYNESGEQDMDLATEIMEQIVEFTNELYELVPDRSVTTGKIQPLYSQHYINQKKASILSLLEVESSVKIILGAQFKQSQIHPLDYCYSAVGCKIMQLDNRSLEKVAILSYLKQTSDVVNRGVEVYAIERKGEKERFSKWLDSKSDRMLLWHGSRTSNFLGILKDGLRTAPKGAPQSGEVFGRGIYFSDAFGKADMYTCGLKKAILLCEVALGKTKKISNYKDRDELDAKVLKSIDTVEVLGNHYPNPRKNVVIPNGMILPCGEFLARNGYLVNYNEFVVQNESQIKLRYLVVF